MPRPLGRDPAGPATSGDSSLVRLRAEPGRLASGRLALAGPPPGGDSVAGPLALRPLPVRFRAAPGASGCAGTAIRCPYHGWTYGLDGSLRAAPFLPELRRYRDRLALHPVAVTTWGGFVFARLDAGRGGRRPLADQLNGADGRLAAYPLAELRSAHRLVYRIAANWKVILENYNECYHCGPVHPELCELIPAFRRGGGLTSTGRPASRTAPAPTRSRSTGTTRRAPFPGLGESDRDAAPRRADPAQPHAQPVGRPRRRVHGVAA